MIKEWQLFLKKPFLDFDYKGLDDGYLSEDLRKVLISLEEKTKLNIIDGDVILKSPQDVVKLLNDNKIRSFQEFFKTSPLGITYSGPVDGVLSPEFIMVLKDFESKVATAVENPLLIGKLFNGKEILSDVDDVKKVIELLKINKKAQAKLESMSPDERNGYGDHNLLKKDPPKNKGFMDYDPKTTQQTGIKEIKVPTVQKTDSPNQDERVMALAKLFSE